MTAKTIRPGQTLTATGSVGLSGYLSIQGSMGGGGPGGIGVVAKSAIVTNNGVVRIFGGGPVSRTGQPIGGGTLAVNGALNNAGLIDLTGGSYGPGSFSGGGGYLLDTGMLTNTGTILIGIGLHGGSDGDFDGRGAILQIDGVLLNQSAITVEAPTYYSFYDSGRVIDEGNFTNAGILTLAGGGVSGVTGIHGGNGAVLSGGGTLTNLGTVVVHGGAGATVLSARGGGGGYLGMNGVIVNDGTIVLDGGSAGLETHQGSEFGFGGGYGGKFHDGTAFTNNGVLIVGAGASAADSKQIGGRGADAYFYFVSEPKGFNNTGTIVIDGAAGSATIQAAPQYSGVLTLEGLHSYNSGLIEVGGAGTNAYGGGELILGDKPYAFVLVNSGTIAIGVESAPGGAAGQLDILGYNDQLRLAGGSIVQTGSGIAQEMIYNRGTIIGYGAITVSGITNNGLITASGGLLGVTGNLTGDGHLAVDPGATLSLSGTVASYESLLLSSTGTLVATAATASLKITSTAGGNVIIAGGGTTTLSPKDTNLTVTLASASDLTLSQAGFITAIGSTGADTIVAGAVAQTLEGKGGSDTLIGYTGSGDAFLGTAADLNGDTIGNFAGTDVIDLTDLAPGAALSLTYTPGATSGVLTVSEGGVTSKITLTGSFTQGEFTTSSNGHGGVLIGLH